MYMVYINGYIHHSFNKPKKLFFADNSDQREYSFLKIQLADVKIIIEEFC